MIATLSAIMYVHSERQELLSNSGKVVQKGQAISKLNEKEYQLYNFTVFLPTDDDEAQSNGDEQDGETLQPFVKDLVYLVHAKFSANAEASLQLLVTSNTLLNIPIQDIPISKAFVHLLGRTEHVPVLHEAGYQVALSVKPYLSSEQYVQFTVTLVHGVNGRLKRAFDNTRRLSLIHTSGVLIIHKKALYCDVLEYSFVSSKSESNGNITVPWKTTTVDLEKEEKTSSIENRVAAAHEKSSNSSSTSTSPKRTRQAKGKQKAMKVSDIAASLLDQQPEDNKANSEEKVTEEIVISDDTLHSSENEYEPHSKVKIPKRLRTTRNSNK
jgi:hypothetical protein